MPDYSQERQPIRIDTALPDDALLLEGFEGREAVSEPFLFTLDLVSEDPDIDGAALLRSEIRIDIDLPDGEVRPIHGIIRRFAQRGQDRDLVSYRAEVVPWLWFLSLRKDSRIFQGMDALEIIEAVFADQGYSDFEIRCTRNCEKREYTVQYRESDLNFVSRLLEEEGIFYFFEHTDSKHILVLADDMSAIEACESQEEARMHPKPVPDEDVVTTFEHAHSVHTGEITLGDYDYLQPSLTLRGNVAGDEPEESYDYPGGFTELDHGEHLVRLALEREEARRHRVEGSGSCRAFRSGTRFDLVDHFQAEVNTAWVLLEIHHRAYNAAYRGARESHDLDYRNDFVAMPHAVPYRPPLRAEKPVIRGAQTAQVVGPSGEEIYVDEHGRVKLHFHWDRLGGRDEGSSCWVRVSQNWAGKKWGGMFIPHIGQEVIVDFLEGDPDRPIITGRVYNAENRTPLKLPDAKHQSIIRDDFDNQIIFDATPGKEHISIHSPNHSSTMEIGKSVKVRTDSDLNQVTIGNETKATYGNSASYTNGSSASATIGSQASFFMGAKASADVGGSISIFVGNKISVDLSTSFSMKFAHSVTFSKGKDYKMGSSDSYNHTKGANTINSDEEARLIGGPQDESVILANDQALLLEFGANPAAPPFSGAVGQGLALGSVFSGLVGTAGIALTTAGSSFHKMQEKARDSRDHPDEDERNKANEIADSNEMTEMADSMIAGGVISMIGGYATTLALLLVMKESVDAVRKSAGHHIQKHSSLKLDQRMAELKAGGTFVKAEKDKNLILVAPNKKIHMNAQVVNVDAKIKHRNCVILD